MLDKLKLLLGINDTSKDSLLNLLLFQATTEAQNITNNPDTLILEPSIIKMAVYQYNRLGTEGLTSESFSGVSNSYQTDYPEPILRELKAHRKIRVIR